MFFGPFFETSGCENAFTIEHGVNKDQIIRWHYHNAMGKVLRGSRDLISGNLIKGNIMLELESYSGIIRVVVLFINENWIRITIGVITEVRSHEKIER